MRVITELKKEALRGKKVFVRADFNVPIKDGKIQDDTRIRKALPTINYLIEAGAKITLASHLGRPKGERKPELSLKPVATRLSELIGKEVKFVDDCIGDRVKEATKQLKDGEVLLLENLRFYKGETKNDEEFAKKLAEPFEIYVNDAFGTAHRKHASVYGMVKYFKIKAAGLLLFKEVSTLKELLESPSRPFIVILGGAKVKDKIGVIKNLLDKADKFIIGGGMAYTFVKAKGGKIGNSLFDESHFEEVKELLSKYRDKFLIPVDHIVSKSIEKPVEIQNLEEIPEDFIGVDIGNETRKIYREAISEGKMIFWNGPMGIFEIPEFADGTKTVAQAVKEATFRGAKSVIGGGDTVSAINKAGFSEEDFTHVSTGGGATLEFLSGIELPAVRILEEEV